MRAPGVVARARLTLAATVAVGLSTALAGCGGGSAGVPPSAVTAVPVTATGLSRGCAPAATDGNGGPYPAAAASDCQHRKQVEVDVVTDPKTAGGFSPSNMLISVGTTVRFVWKSGGHNLSPFHTDIEDTGYSFSKVFAVHGQYSYQCQVHPGQNGLIVVR